MIKLLTFIDSIIIKFNPSYLTFYDRLVLKTIVDYSDSFEMCSSEIFDTIFDSGLFITDVVNPLEKLTKLGYVKKIPIDTYRGIKIYYHATDKGVNFIEIKRSK